MNPPPNLRNTLWQGYTPNTEVEKAELAFYETFKRNPDYAWEWGCLHLGPITQEEHDKKRSK